MCLRSGVVIMLRKVFIRVARTIQGVVQNTTLGWSSSVAWSMPNVHDPCNGTTRVESCTTCAQQLSMVDALMRCKGCTFRARTIPLAASLLIYFSPVYNCINIMHPSSPKTQFGGSFPPIIA